MIHNMYCHLLESISTALEGSSVRDLCCSVLLCLEEKQKNKSAVKATVITSFFMCIVSNWVPCL